MQSVLVNFKRLALMLSTVLFVFGVQGVSDGQNLTLSASPQQLSEAALDEGVVTLSLQGGTYVDFRWDIAGALTVSGIPGVTIGTFGPAWFGVERVSDTEIEVELGFDGNIDTDSRLTFTVSAGAIEAYEGPALTAQVLVTVSAEQVPERDVPDPPQQETEPEDTSDVLEYIQGPWLWMIAPGSDIESDQLARVSNGAITENHVATHGVNEGDTVGGLQWTRGRIPLTTPVCKTEQTNVFGFIVNRRSCSSDNINELVNDIGLSENSDLNHYSAYALINIVSPREQNDVLMGVGSDDTVKVWLNGEVVHKFLGGHITINGNTRRTGRSTTGIQDKFYTNLKAGNNLLLVKVSEFSGEWGLFFEIYLGDEDFTTYLPGTIPQLPDPQPDLVVEAVQAEPATVAPEEEFRLYATLGNSGTGESTATTLRYYRSTDAVISTEDTQLSSAQRDPLAVNATIRRYLRVTAPTTPGTYYYGVCVDSVTNESDTDNNCSSTVSVTVTAPPEVSEDVNEDGVVDVQDLVYVAQQYGQTGTNSADVNDDGVVNIDDLILVAAVLDADAAAAPSLYADALDVFTVRDIELWLSQAQQRDLTDPSVQRGILFLEQLLASMVPKETLLLANYPNPFNPETWIPYQLSKPADVTLTIYGVNGQMVRQLALGHQDAGMYQSRSRAAYWDGRNAFGEPVASGLYFYTLTAGDFTATRKMLILK